MLVSVARRVTCPGDTQPQPLTVTRSALATRDSCVAVMADWASMKVRPELGAGHEKEGMGWFREILWSGPPRGTSTGSGGAEGKRVGGTEKVSLRWVLTAGPARSVCGLLPGQLDGTPRGPLLPGLP